MKQIRGAVCLPSVTFPALLTGFQVRGHGGQGRLRPVGWFPVLVFACVVASGG